ncbi:uncharacterized protein PITG_15916 [Phytophthora infestans T30-4]|uniref:Wings apart-like protein C-terminal domain-containing protein n=1 Tax=Phytophthora infestans (strain T30-4) TaxID=403677 RepID=D0NS16_PHYIT|nr:uncharacterized protein PITG_15916 [Phytophthora infestans T30-4]EEY63557.1 hypothetical protein PITG_15916 [Phytophthora infestans T30-4]|eukprot:XP_002898144.1 hypothetical protein PITG_15916 [Phytophthora infestans T30-4]
METSKSSPRRTRRSDGPIATPLECFRQGKDSESMRNALAELAMRLVDADDREDFRKADGVTAIVDHLARILEEQATLSYAWSTSEAFGTAYMLALCRWEEYEVHDSLQLTLVAICHASIDSDISAEMHELGTLEILYRTLSVIPEQLSDYVPFELAAEFLTNIAAAESSRSAATPERLSATLSLFLRAGTDPHTATLGIALSDLLCNLCCDQACSLLLICELDTRRPRGHLRHSGVVYLAELTDKSQDGALKQSMEALVHNLSWSDPAGKRSIQKLALSSFMHRFAVEPTINSYVKIGT